MTGRLRDFAEVWIVDTEFFCPDGCRPIPICLVAQELHSGRRIRLWADELLASSSPPYPTDNRTLFVAYYASAEISIHLACGWKLPTRVLDLYAEFSNLTNGRYLQCGRGLLGALIHFDLSGLAAAEKQGMRDLARRGGPFSPGERSALIDYCESDVAATLSLLKRMEDVIDFPRALVRGRFMVAAAKMEHRGVPIDGDAYARLCQQWPNIQLRLIDEVNRKFGVYENRSFRQELFRYYLARNRMSWPTLPSGALALDEQTFREMSALYPAIRPLHDLRQSLSQLRLSSLAVGPDNRNRCLLSAFSSRTSRNQPSSISFIFGRSVWMRSLIRPEHGFGLAYLDWSQQEFGIAAALSGDDAMCAAYQSGDPYLAFARQVGAVPEDATKSTHGPVRDLYKACALAVQYGMGPEALARRIGQPVRSAADLIRSHREVYRQFWRWSDAAVDRAMLYGSIQTVFGWNLHITERSNARTVRNFPMQGNGAEMLRLGCCLATEGGIRVCAPVHDALLIEAPLAELDDAVRFTQEMMTQANTTVLGGFELRSDAEVMRFPNRFVDRRGQKMWDQVWDIANRLDIEDGTTDVTASGALVAPSADTRPI